MFLRKQVFLVLGLSRSGRSVTEFLLSKKASVYIYDDIYSERVLQTAAGLEGKGDRKSTR